MKEREFACGLKGSSSADDSHVPGAEMNSSAGRHSGCPGVSRAASVDSAGAGVRSPSPDGLEVSRSKYGAAPPPTTPRTMMTSRIVSVLLIGGSSTPLSWQGSRILLAVGCLCLFVDQCDDFLSVLVRAFLLYELSRYGQYGDVIVWVAGSV